jgi:ribonuclease T2
MRVALSVLLGAILSLIAATAPQVQARDATYVLAATWQPAFCELRSRLPECRALGPSDPGATAFSLHGLWPQPRGNVYCGVDPDTRALDEAGRWEDLPPVPLAEETRSALAVAMPGATSHLDRHEWVKHGTCYGADPETYYRDSLRLLAALNESAVGRLFADAIGGRLDADAIHAATELAFGPGAARRLEIVCRLDGPRRLIVELRLELAAPLDRPLPEIVADAPPRPAGCESGIVDPVGAQ